MTVKIQYIFIRDDGVRDSFDIKLASDTGAILDIRPQNPPDWTRLSFHQCPHCGLTSDQRPYCPAALSLAPIVKRFDGLHSHDKLSVEIITAERKIRQQTTAQRAIGSMMGLVFATSGCPHAAFFRPMARFHLPLASEEETVYRAVSMYLLAQYFKQKQGDETDFDLNGLAAIYSNIQIVNKTIAERLRAATETDSSINAVIFLDMYAKAMPYAIKTALDEVRYLFTPYLSGHD
ncbi:MAG: hypothetical protein KAI75_06080 [Desulfobulbaceae bacterium]|nr:hypothetical protein [Desulfobulbaceae bacterium]